MSLWFASWCLFTLALVVRRRGGVQSWRSVIDEAVMGDDCPITAAACQCSIMQWLRIALRVVILRRAVHRVLLLPCGCHHGQRRVRGPLLSPTWRVGLYGIHPQGWKHRTAANKQVRICVYICVCNVLSACQFGLVYSKR